MQQHEFNDEVVAAIARQNAKITRAFNLVTLAIVVSVITALASAATIVVVVNR